MNKSSFGNACSFTERKLVIVTLISVLLRVPKLTSVLQVAALNQMGKSRHQFTLMLGLLLELQRTKAKDKKYVYTTLLEPRNI